MLAARPTPQQRGRDANEAVDVDELQRRFDAALAELSPPLREAFVLRVIETSEDHSSSFEPVRFRGVLILALVVACADVVTLLRTITGAGSRLVVAYFAEDYESCAALLPSVGWTAAAAALMAVNIWGLLRLRTWALLSNMLANIAIAAVALGGVLTVGTWIAIALAMTAGIQLLLPLPILAVALGLGGARQYAWVGPVLLRVVVPAAVLVTIVVATLHLRWSIPASW